MTEFIEGMFKVYEDARAVRDELGAIRAEVWLYKKTGDDDPVWSQLLPTPTLRYIEKQDLQEGGVAPTGNIMLRGIPQGKYTEEDLVTQTDDPTIKKYIVLKPRDAGTSAYLTTNIRRKLLSFDVTILRYEAINEGALTLPVAGNV